MCVHVGHAEHFHRSQDPTQQPRRKTNMTRTRILSTTAIASILGVALPAFAQAPAPAPMYAPAPAPMMAPAPAPEAASMPAAPMMAPRAADDMTGSVGFGTGV